MARYYYETQERAFAPGIADGWPEIIPAPHTKNGRLVRKEGDPSDAKARLHQLYNMYQEDCDKMDQEEPWDRVSRLIQFIIEEL